MSSQYKILAHLNDRLLRLLLTLPVSIGSIECAFSTLKIIKIGLRNTNTMKNEFFLQQLTSIYVYKLSKMILPSSFLAPPLRGAWPDVVFHDTGGYVGPAYRLLTGARQKLHTKRRKASVLWTPSSWQFVHYMSHSSRTATSNLLVVCGVVSHGRRAGSCTVLPDPHVRSHAREQ